MSDNYLHGAYGQIQAVGTRVADVSQGVIVYVGTAPVHTVAGGAANVNVPILVNNMGEAQRLLGYSDDWAGFTLCEPMHVHFEIKGVGPIVFINVLDPTKHKADEGGDVQLTPANGRITIPSADKIVLDSVAVAGKEKGKDFTVGYNASKKTIVISELSSGALGTEEVQVTYDIIDTSKVKETDVIGESDGDGINTGLYAVKNVYQLTGYVPSFLACPGFSSIPAVHAAMVQNSSKVNKHWDMYMFVDLPITNQQKTMTLDEAYKFKKANGYNQENETVYFPLAQGVDGRIYHISVLAAANFQELLLEQDGIPYKTASNTECAVIQNLYLGEGAKGRIYDDSIINEKLNKNGIASAAYVGGRWVIWGCHSADYDQDNATQINVAETTRMMLYYVSNDFQHRRTPNVDKPMTSNDLKMIVSEEQTRLDALVKIGALTYGEVRMNNAQADAMSDIMMGDFSFVFDITTTPLAKSLTAIVNWTDAGFITYYESLAD